MIGLVAAMTGARDRSFHNRTGYRWLVPQGAFVWVGIEMIRGLLPMVGTWAFVAYALYDQPWLIQPASIFGIYGLNLLILFTNYAIAQWIIAFLDQRLRFEPDLQPSNMRRARHWSIGVGIALIAWIVLSSSLLPRYAGNEMYDSAHKQTSLTTDTDHSLRVAAIHPASRIRSDEDLQQLYEMTRRAAEAGARLVVWHEGALPFDPQVNCTSDLRHLAAETGAHLAIAYVVQTKQGLRNEATVLTPDGRFLGVYGKDHPVIWGGEVSLTRGTYPVYDTPLGKVGTAICYDMDFTDTARKLARNGAQIVAVPSFDWKAIAARHYTHLVFRAIENRVTFVKADVGFDYAIIDPYGRIVKATVTPVPEPAVLIADVKLGPSNAPAIRWGDWIGWLSLIGMGFFISMDLTTARRFRKSDIHSNG